MKYYTNPLLIDKAVEPFIGTADIDEEYEIYKDVDTNNQNELKSFLNKWLLPYFQNYSDEMKSRIKVTLRHFLACNDMDYSRECESHLFAFKTPNNAKDFFICVWETLYPGEDYILLPEDEYIPIKNIFRDYHSLCGLQGEDLETTVRITSGGRE